MERDTENPPTRANEWEGKHKNEFSCQLERFPFHSLSQQSLPLIEKKFVNMTESVMRLRNEIGR